jgi:amidase
MSRFPEYDEHDALGLAELVHKGEVSPAELVEAAIERIEARNPALNAVVHKNYERARRQAASELPDGPFRGVPFLLKDLGAEDAGEPCTASTAALLSWCPDRDAELVARYKRAGLVILGRTNSPELGIYGVTEPRLRGPARNPWDLGRTPGGSSGGSAAVASRMVPMAHGGDGGGSIRIPAAHCGLVGLKPTRARNPSGPFAGEQWGGQVVEHVLARSVRDSAAALDATHGPDTGAPYVAPAPERPFLEEVGRTPGRLRIAFTTASLYAEQAHPDCVRAVQEAARLAEELGHELVEARPDFDRERLVRAYLLIVSVGTAAAVRGIAAQTGRPPRAADYEEPTWLLRIIGEKVGAARYEEARQFVQLEARRIAGFFEAHDVLLTATAARPPVRVGELAPKPSERAAIQLLRVLPLRRLLFLALDQMAHGPLTATPNTMLFNQTGQPAVSLPLFWNAEGLPIGTQWVGRFGDEATLIRLASQLEKARPWAARRPPA